MRSSSDTLLLFVCNHHISYAQLPHAQRVPSLFGIYYNGAYSLSGFERNGLLPGGVQYGTVSKEDLQEEEFDGYDSCDDDNAEVLDAMWLAEYEVLYFTSLCSSYS
jgi:hypothetical protein